jgi:hypothetical protein
MHLYCPMHLLMLLRLENARPEGKRTRDKTPIDPCFGAVFLFD